MRDGDLDRMRQDAVAAMATYLVYFARLHGKSYLEALWAVFYSGQARFLMMAELYSAIQTVRDRLAKEEVLK